MPAELIVAVAGATTIEVSTGAAGLTVNTPVLLVIAPETAVILDVRTVLPVFFPVARPVELTVAAEALEEFHVKVTPDMVALNWSFAVAVNC